MPPAKTGHVSELSGFGDRLCHRRWVMSSYVTKMQQTSPRKLFCFGTLLNSVCFGVLTNGDFTLKAYNSVKDTALIIYRGNLQFLDLIFLSFQ